MFLVLLGLRLLEEQKRTVIDVDGSPGSEAQLSGLQIKGVTGQESIPAVGGCVEVKGGAAGTLFVESCTFENGRANQGGGIWLRKLDLLFRGKCAFTNCQAVGESADNGCGGAIYAATITVSVGDPVTITKCHAAKLGGGLYIKDLDSRFRWSGLFDSCTSGERGSTIFVDSASNGLSLYGQTSIKVAGADGKAPKDAIYVKSPSVDMTNVQIDLASVAGTELPTLAIETASSVKLTQVSFARSKDDSDFKNGVITCGNVPNAQESVLECNNVTFTHIKSGKGNLIYGSHLQLSLTECVFDTVVISEEGGVIHSGAAQKVKIYNSTIRRAATASGKGGAVFVSDKTVHFDCNYTIFDGNAYFGGSITCTGALEQFVMDNCNFSNHQAQKASSDPSQDCLIHIGSSSSTVNLTNTVFVDNNVAVKGILSVRAASITVQDCTFARISVLSDSKDYHKGLIVVDAGAETAFTLSQTTFTDCNVAGSGGIVVSPGEASSGTLATSSVKSIALSDCEFTGCKSETTPELSFTCEQLSISSTTFSCSATQKSSFIYIHITQAGLNDTVASISGTFTRTGSGSDFKFPLIDFHSDAGTQTNIQKCSFKSTITGKSETETLYILLANDGDVHLSTVDFDANRDSSVQQANGSHGQVVFDSSDSKPGTYPSKGSAIAIACGVSIPAMALCIFIAVAPVVIDKRKAKKEQASDSSTSNSDGPPESAESMPLETLERDDVVTTTPPPEYTDEAKDGAYFSE